MLKNQYVQKAIWYIESEIDLLSLIIQSSVQHSLKNVKSYKSKVYFIPKSKGLGIDSMGEFAVSFELSDQFIDEEGKPVPFIHIAQVLETAFNFSFGDAYRSKGRVFKRKPYNLTKALDYLKNLIIRADRKNKMKKDAFVDC